jgi:hypothetical protein
MYFALQILLGMVLALYATATALLHFTTYSGEPFAVDTALPFLGPIVNVSRKKWRYYTQLR